MEHKNKFYECVFQDDKEIILTQESFFDFISHYNLPIFENGGHRFTYFQGIYVEEDRK